MSEICSFPAKYFVDSPDLAAKWVEHIPISEISWILFPTKFRHNLKRHLNLLFSLSREDSDIPRNVDQMLRWTKRIPLFELKKTSPMFDFVLLHNAQDLFHHFTMLRMMMKMTGSTSIWREPKVLAAATQICKQQEPLCSGWWWWWGRLWWWWGGGGGWELWWLGKIGFSRNSDLETPRTPVWYLHQLHPHDYHQYHHHIHVITIFTIIIIIAIIIIIITFTFTIALV